MPRAPGEVHDRERREAERPHRLEVRGFGEVDVGRRDDDVRLDVDRHERLRVRVVPVEQLAERATAIGERDLGVVVPDEVGVPVVEQELEVGVVVLGALVGRDPSERRPRRRASPRGAAACASRPRRNPNGRIRDHGRSFDRGRGAGRRAQRHGAGVVAGEPARDVRDHQAGGHLELVSEFEVAGGGFVDPHHHPTHEFYYVTSGRGIMTIGDETREIGQGDLVHIPPDAVHSLRPVSDHAPIHCFCFAVGVPDAGPVNYTEH